MASRERRLGYLAVGVAAVLFGTWPSFSKIALEELHPLTIVVYGQLIPGLLFAPTVRGLRLSSRDARLVLLTVATGGLLAPVLYFFGLELTTASNAVLLSNTESLFTVVLAFLLLRERLARLGYACLAAMAVGAFFVTTDLRLGDASFLEHLLGNLLLVGSAFFWALTNTASTHLLKRIRVLPLLAFQLALGSAFVLPFVFASGASLAVPVGVIPVLAFLALGGIGLFAVLFFHAFRTIGAMRTGSVLSTSSIWGLLLALYLFPTEVPGPWQAVGGTMMIAALVALYATSETRPAASDETLKPEASDGPRHP